MNPRNTAVKDLSNGGYQFKRSGVNCSQVLQDGLVQLLNAGHAQ